MIKQNKNKKESLLLIGSQARDIFKETILELSQAVVETLGPNGSCCIIDLGYGRVKVTKDGVSVAKSINSSNKFKNTIMSLMKEASESVNEKSGDGTTTCILIMREMLLNGLKKIELGYSKKKLGSAMNKILKLVHSKIKEISVLPTAEDLKNLAINSANNDKDLGELVYSAINKFGGEINRHYLINVEESKSIETKVEFTGGLRIDSGYMSPYFIVDGNKQIEYNDVYLVIVNGKVDNQDFLVKFMEFLSIKGVSGLIICDDMSKSLLNMLLLNCHQKTIKIVVVKTPSSGNEKIKILTDIAILTGAKIHDITSHYGEEIIFDDNYLGYSNKVIVTQTNTSFIGEVASKEEMNKHIAVIKTQITELEDQGITSGIEIEKLYERYSMLNGGVVVIKVGGDTEIEISEKKDRVLDAVSAVKTGKNGILPGGGITLLRISMWLEEKIVPKLKDKDEIAAYEIFINALQKPIEQILINSGYDVEKVLIIKEIKKSKNYRFGYDALKYEFTDMIERGIVDSTESVIQVLKSAVSISVIGLLLSTINVSTQD